MSQRTDWLPAARDGQIDMCRNWVTYLTEERRTAWGIPAAEFTALGSLYTAAWTLLQKAKDEDLRTHVITVECQEAFKNLTAKMRFFRDRYFKMPPLTAGDWAALGFRPPDTHPTPIPPPDGMPLASLSYPGGPRSLVAHLGPLAGTEELDPRSDYGYAVYVGIMPPGGATVEQAVSKKHYLRQPPPERGAVENGPLPPLRAKAEAARSSCRPAPGA